MKFTTALTTAAVLVASVASVPIRRAVPANLVPQFGIKAGQKPDGVGNCIGANNIKIPCTCPPDRNSFIASLNANVAAGHAVHNPSVAVSFPTDNSKASQLARMTASLVTLQNLRGPGVGCPASSTTFVAQQAAIQAKPGKRDVPDNLVPQFGIVAGTGPDGFGNCIGVNGIKIPCSCPPDRGSFIASLNANVAAGHAVNNPGVAVSFPTDNSKASQLARMTASLVTLQNLHGPGVGCPASSTTFVAQQAAIQAAP